MLNERGKKGSQVRKRGGVKTASFWSRLGRSRSAFSRATPTHLHTCPTGKDQFTHPDTIARLAQHTHTHARTHSAKLLINKHRCTGVTITI